MLAYAANGPRFAERRRSPKALLIIVGAHVIALAAVMTSKMDVPLTNFVPTKMIDLREVPPPPPTPAPPPPKRRPVDKLPAPSVVDRVEPLVSANPSGPLFQDPPVQPQPAVPIAGSGSIVTPSAVNPPVRVAARFNTPDWALKPPYPHEKRQLEQEATLRLRLSIDDKGRVVAVEPVGDVDPVFLAAARRHLIAKWRYKPATEDGRPVPSSTVVTLRFELEA